ncbi:hypothetical protein K504DRAFT_534812 [Pleomassaria siparia CBS 279.74]|uniref:Rhodopsin domain-containing protein n=1 Tax=Pleomassaria siparia CBS 279.74 TaxID=1314801 RepID=A0A6G1K718_9PLEO|nr:hypothetical protein K504DRAFT_534812 [Pleomassaria siparia CBS 279.74]
MPAWTADAVAKRQAALPVYSPDDTNAPIILAITASFFAASTLAVLLRCYVRVRMLKGFGIDDWLMVVAMIFAAATFACFVLETQYGMGKHFMVLVADPTALKTVAHILYFHSLIIMIGVSIVKISIAYFLLRLSPRRSHQIFLYGVIVFIVALTITCAMTLVFQCIPVQAAWDASLRPPPFGTGTAKCYSNVIFRNLGMMNSAFNIITDALFATLPVPLIWSLQLNVRTKLSLIAILSLGWFACAAAIVKAIQQFHILEDLDWTYRDSFSVWNFIEFTIGILAASLPTLKPLFSWALETARAMTSGNRSHGSGFRGAVGYKPAMGYHKASDHSSTSGGKSVELRSLASRGESGAINPYNVEIHGRQGPTGIAERDAWDMEGGKSSQESIMPPQHPDLGMGKNRIVCTTEVHVS